jgi:Tol biopolymer transport system component
MTDDRRFERHLPEILEDLYLGPSPTYRDEVLAAAVRPRRRPAWTFPGRWIPMDVATRVAPSTRLPLRQLGILALIAILVAVAVAVAIGSQQRHLPAPFGPARNGLIPYISGGDIYVGDPVTGDTKLLLRSPDGQGAFGPGYSPDGTRMAFLRPIKAGAAASSPPADIYVMRDDGTDLLKITTSPITDVVWANWTPDGRHMAVIEPIDGTNRLELLDTDKQLPPVRLATPAIPDQIAFRPPFGKQILFRGRIDGGYALYTLDLDTNAIRTITESNSGTDMTEDLNNATYSPDGTRIFFQRWTPDSIQLWVMDADGTNPHEFVSEPGPGWDGLPSTSPDGRWVAWWHVNEDENGNADTTQHVSVVRADGKGPIIPTGPALTGNAHWVWSPDSTKILMYPTDSSTKSPYLLDPAGGQFTTVPWQSDSDLDWQRLGQ